MKPALPTAQQPQRRDRTLERGQVLALFALGLVALIGAVGLSIDGSRMLEERRHVQAAADLAASAAAYQRCTSTTASDATARTAGRAVAKLNGMDDDAPTVVVNIDPVLPVTGPDTDPYDYRAVISSTIGGTFSGVLGFSTFDVSAEATAGGSNCGTTGTTGVASPGAAYAGGICTVAGKFGIDISGSNSSVIGGVHTNDDVSVGGSGNIFTEPPTPPDEPFTHVGSINPAAVANNTFQMLPLPGYPRQVAMPTPQWPAGWAPSDMTGGSGIPAAGTFLKPYYDLAVANGTFSTSKIDTINTNGVYYTTSPDGIDVGSIAIPGGTASVTLVAPNGVVKVGASSMTVNPVVDASLPRQGILMIANAARAPELTCESPVIMVSGSNVTWNGIMWAVSGQMEMSGSSTFAANGSVVAHSIKLNGSNITIRYNASFFPTSPSLVPTVILEE